MTYISIVETKKQLRKFITWPETLYKGCENWVPPLLGDEFDTLNPKKNAAFEFCEAQLYLAYNENDEIVGRIAGIINRKANEIWKENVVRFGWFDFIESVEVAKALTDKVARWGKSKGCTKIKGPLGFTDMDKEGSLVEGYENLSPFTCLYNYPYYDRILKEIGFEKDADWTQKIFDIPDQVPESYNYTDRVTERFGLRIYEARSTRELGRKYGMDLFHLCNESFSELFEFTPLTDTQIKRYLKTYIAILDPRFVAVCVNAEDKPVGFAFCVPSLSKAVKKIGGRLFPFGFIDILKALRKNDTLEALMIGVLPEYQGKGASMLLMKYIHQGCLDMGIRKLVMNPQLEDNFKVQTLFDSYDPKPFMRRRCYVKTII